MSRGKWALIKQSKGFYVRMFRHMMTWLIFMCAVNVLLGLAIAQVYLSQKEPNYYATYGETPPVELTPLSRPNDSMTPILAEDLNEDTMVRAIPQ